MLIHAQLAGLVEDSPDKSKAKKEKKKPAGKADLLSAIFFLCSGHW